MGDETENQEEEKLIQRRSIREPIVARRALRGSLPYLEEFHHGNFVICGSGELLQRRCSQNHGGTRTIAPCWHSTGASS